MDWVDNLALVIRTRTDQNLYSHSTFFYYYDTSDVNPFFNVDGKLKVMVSGTSHTINMTWII